MFPPLVRFVLVVASIVYGGYTIYMGQWTGALFLVIGLLLLWGHFRYGTVWFAFNSLKFGDYDGAKALLEKVRSPELLNEQNRTYYNLTKGLIAAKEGDMKNAEQLLLVAQEGSLRTTNDRAFVAIVLAELALARGDKEAASQRLDIARSLPARFAVKSRIEELEERLNTSGTETSNDRRD